MELKGNEARQFEEKTRIWGERGGEGGNNEDH